MEDEGERAAPQLVYTYGGSNYQTFCTFSLVPPYHECHRRSVVEMFGKTIVGSSHGWLILRSVEDCTLFSLFDPVTSQSLRLPPVEAATNNKDDGVNCTLSSAPDSTQNAETTIYLHLIGVDLLFYCRLTRPNCSWVALKVRIAGISAHNLSITSLTNGSLFGWAFPSSYYSAEIPPRDDLDLEIPLTNLEINEPDFVMDYEGLSRYIVECSGRLYCTFIYIIATGGRGIVGIKVCELDLPGKEWEEVSCLEGRAFFLGQGGSSTWCWGGVSNSTTSRSVKQNCVYLFSPLDESGQTLYEYNLLDQSLTPICPCPTLESPHDPPVWLMVSGPNLGFDFWGCEKVVKGSDDRTQGNNKLLIGELPLHMIELMSKYLHVFDYWSFRASCRMFRSAAPPTKSWRTNTMFPSFLFFKNDAGLCSLMDAFRHDLRSSILELSSEPFKIVFSSNDWLLLMIDQESLEFINPFTKEKGEFPTYEELVWSQCFGFSTNPASDDCVTVAAVRVFDATNRIVIHYIRSSDKQWKTCIFDQEQGITFQPSFNAPLFYQGSFWFSDFSGHLGALTLADGQQTWRVFEKPDTGDSSKFNAPYLVEWAGKLYSVFIGEMGRGVKIFEFDDKLEKKWREIEDLRDHILFISCTFCCSRAVRDVNLRNRIYLPRLKGNGIVYYSLDTRKYHVSGNRKEESMNDLYYTKEPMKCCWI